MGRLTVQPTAKADGQMGAFVEAFTRRVEAMPPARPNDRTTYGRVQVAERPACERKHDFEGVEVPMTDEEAAQECRRCLRCDVYGIGALTGRGLEVW